MTCTKTYLTLICVANIRALGTSLHLVLHFAALMQLVLEKYKTTVEHD